MTRRERLMATLQGRPVDRPAVSFYEIGGWMKAPTANEFDVFNEPSWQPLLQLAVEQTDLMRMVDISWKEPESEWEKCWSHKQWREQDSILTRATVKAGKRTLTSLYRRDRDLQTSWGLEHLLKDTDDIRAFLDLPEPPVGTADVSAVFAEETALGDAGIVCIECSDPMSRIGRLFSMEDYTIAALTEPALFHKLLERAARIAFPRAEEVARLCPGRLWRLCGSEYASEPFLPPRLYEEYIVRYTGVLVKTIQASGGYARIHSHGRLRGILPHLAAMRPDALDPLEPPPQGDMELWELREKIGRDVVLLGNLEIADIENLPPPAFEKKVLTALKEGTTGVGRGFILHPSSSPYGRTIAPQTMANYQTMVRLATQWGQ